jgi:hypothetical protein
MEKKAGPDGYWLLKQKFETDEEKKQLWLSGNHTEE